MDELKNTTIAALKKQVELLNKDGVSPADQDSAIHIIEALNKLLQTLD
jgi:hypothetical protein